MKINIKRKWFTTKSSSGQMFVDGKYFGETLEDAARAHGVKVYGETCIPAGEYKATINYSNRFKRHMILLYTNDKDLSCDLGGIRFDGIRIHGGNDHTHTEGCVLVAKLRISNDRIQGSLEADLLKLVKSALDRKENVTVLIENVPG